MEDNRDLWIPFIALALAIGLLLAMILNSGEEDCCEPVATERGSRLNGDELEPVVLLTFNGVPLEALHWTPGRVLGRLPPGGFTRRPGAVGLKRADGAWYLGMAFAVAAP